MTYQDVPAKLDYASRIQLMIRDPDLTGETLLFALAALDVLDVRRMQGRRKPSTTRTTMDAFLLNIAESATGKRDLWWIKRVIASDIPRYEIDSPFTIECPAPMIRRDGPCGQNATSFWLDRDPDTGEQAWTGYCRRHLTSAIEADRRSRREAWEANGKPSPSPNKGGILARYFRGNWTKLYAWADRSRTPLDGAVEPTPPRPIFTVIKGGEP